MQMVARVEGVKGKAIVLRGNDIDTDRIIPARYLRAISFEGLERYLFEDDRAQVEARSAEVHPFSDSRYLGSTVLFVGRNFGCGSSREHAVWALQEYGFAVVIAPSFADIFYGNCFKNGLLPIVLKGKEIELLIEYAKSITDISIDLAAQTVDAAGMRFQFDIAPGLKQKMLDGMDDITATLAERSLIEAFETIHRERQPWLFRS